MLKKIENLARNSSTPSFRTEVRQGQIDLAALERDLNKGNAKGQIESKINRMKALLDEFETDLWLSRQLKEYDPDFAEKLAALRNRISDLKND